MPRTGYPPKGLPALLAKRSAARYCKQRIKGDTVTELVLFNPLAVYTMGLGVNRAWKATPRRKKKR